MNSKGNRPDSLTSRSDNAENSVKCSECGNMILLGSGTASSVGSQVTCDVCGATQSIGKGALGSSAMGASSNEDY